MKLATLNPMTWIGKAQKVDPNLSVSTAVSANSSQTTILADTPKDAEIVQGTFVPDIQIDARNDAKRHAARLRHTIESFNEEKQTPLEWLVVKFFTVLAYFLPIVVALVVGMAIGESWSGPFSIDKPFTIFSYVISVGLEMMLPALGYAVTVSVKRAAKDRSQIIWAIVIGALFLGLATGNSFATMFLLESHIDMSKADINAIASMYFRSFGPFIIDGIATIFLSVVTVRNLRKFIKDMQAKEEGIASVSRSEIAVEAAFDKAEMDKEQARNKAERDRMDNQLLIELTRRRNQDTLGNDSNGRGRHGGW